MPRVALVAGARPNFMKLGPIFAALRSRTDVDPLWVDTAQHTDASMRADVLALFDVPPAHFDLPASSLHGEARHQHMREAFTIYLQRERPAGVAVIGDVDGSWACAEAAAALKVPVAHIEAGLRSGDMRMAEERNRVRIDGIASLHLVTEPAGADHLRAEGVLSEGVVLVGNPMVDAVHVGRAHAKVLVVPDAPAPGYVLATLHRAENVDDERSLCGWLDLVRRVATERPVVWILHPRTEDHLAQRGLLDRARATPGVTLLAPQTYVRGLRLLMRAHALLTDSGGMPMEAAHLGVPCLILRDRFEHDVLLETGAARCVGAPRGPQAQDEVLRSLAEARTEEWRLPEPGRLGDGLAARRIADALVRWLR